MVHVRTNALILCDQTTLQIKSIPADLTSEKCTLFNRVFTLLWGVFHANVGVLFSDALRSLRVGQGSSVNCSCGSRDQGPQPKQHCASYVCVAAA